VGRLKKTRGRADTLGLELECAQLKAVPFGNYGPISGTNRAIRTYSKEQRGIRLDNNLENPTSTEVPKTSKTLWQSLLSTAQKLLFGADGLRAGWSLLIFITMLLALLACLKFIAQKVAPTQPHSSAGSAIPLKALLIGESIPFLIILFITWIMAKIERRPNSVYGLGGARPVTRFLGGLAWGVVCLSLLVLALWKGGFLTFDGRLLFGGEVWRYGALWLLGFLFVGLLEEYLTRGFLLYTLARGFSGIYKWLFKVENSQALGFWTAAVGLSALFGLLHGQNPGESPIGLLSAGLAGLVFCFSLRRTGSLWWAIGFHTSWDWAQSYLYGVADSGMMAQHRLLASHPVGKPILSGGATGPEGSVLVLVVFVVIVAVIVFTLPSKRESQPV